MPRDVAEHPPLHNPPSRRATPPQLGGRRPRPARKRPAPRAHPIRHRIAGGILLAKPWTVATAAILAHLRRLHRQIRRDRGAATARRVINALIHRIVARIPVDLRGSPTYLLVQLGIEVSDRAAREAVRILASLSVIVRLGAEHSTSRIRLLAAHRAAVARAEVGRITPAIFAPDAELLGRDPVQLWLPLVNQPRIEGSAADSNRPDAVEERAHTGSLELPMLSAWLRSLPQRPRIQQAAQLLARVGDRVAPGLQPCSIAHARSLLLAAGDASDHRTCAAVARALGWLRDHGHLETRAGDVVPAAETHPDVVLMGVDAPAETRAASGRMQAYLHRLGVHRPDLLGHAEARKLAASIWWHRQHAETRLGLQDRRVLATGRACPGAMYAKAIAAAPKHLLETAWYCRRDGFSATMRRRSGEHSRVTTVSPGDALYDLGGDGVTVRCGSPAGPVLSRGGEPERPRHDRHRGGPAGPGCRRDGHASAQLDGAGAQGRVLAAVSAPSARQAGRPGRHPRSPHQASRPAAEDPR